MTTWHDDRHNLATVARYMGERGDSVEDVAYAQLAAVAKAILHSVDER